MTEPTRLLDDANAPEEATALLGSLSAPEAPSPAKQAELVRQLASLASPGAVATVSTALWLKAGAVLGVLGLAGAWASVKLGGRDTNPAPRALVAATSVATPVTAPLAPTDATAPPSSSPPGPVGLAPSTAHAKGPTRDNLADEEALLEQARRVATASPSQALGLLQQYQRRFPGGQLTAERMFLSVDVLTRLGNTNAARKQADALMRAFPRSVYAAQVKARSSTPGR